MSDDESNIVKVDFSAEREPRAALIRKGWGPKGHRGCLHSQSVVVGSERRVYCRDCDVELDPIAVLMRLAHDGNRWERMHEDMAHLRKSLVDLGRREKNAKARVRKWEKRAQEAGGAA